MWCPYANASCAQLNGFAEAVRAIAVFYDGVVVPGAVSCSYPGRGFDRRVLRLGLHKNAVAGGDGDPVRLRVHRG